MTKNQSQAVDKQDKQKHKAHKTLRQKLRKRRAQQKQHLKQKKQQRKQFDAQKQKKDFFKDHFSSQNTQKSKQQKKDFKYKKIKKYIQKFINIYKDDLEDFFGLFKQFDQGGFIDISGLENKKLQKVLKKLFLYLPLTTILNKNHSGKQTLQYKKKKQISTINLESIIRNLVTQSIQYYLQFGTDQEIQKPNKQGLQSSSQDEKCQKPKNKLKKQPKQVTVNVKKQDEGIFTLPHKGFMAPQINMDVGFGPMIPAQEREKIADLFEKQLIEMQNQKTNLKQQEQNEFDKIFSMGTQTSKLKGPIKKVVKSTLQDFPDQLLAEGSAKIGQKVAINQQELQQYDAIHRPMKLIDQHRQIMAINRGPNDQKNGSRKPFDRQRDVVNSRNKLNLDNMKNGVFFNFGDRMSAPKKSNNFL